MKRALKLKGNLKYMQTNGFIYSSYRLNDLFHYLAWILIRLVLLMMTKFFYEVVYILVALIVSHL